MSRSWVSRFAWGLYAWSFVLLSGAFILLALNPGVRVEGASRGVLDLAPVIVGALAIGALGGLVASRQPGNPMGWSFLAAGLAFAYVPLAEQYALRAYVIDPGSLPLGAWAAWTLDTTAGAAVFVPVLLIVYLFPNGRLVSRRWRVPFVIGLATVVADTIASGLAPVLRIELLPKGSPDIVNPISAPAIYRLFESVSGLSFLVFFPIVTIGAVSLIVRFRRSRGVERQQLKWISLSAVIATIGGLCILLAVVGVSVFADTLIGPALFIVGLGSIPFTASIAILRYRLFDIDRLISRTLSYAIVTAVLAGTFTVLVLGPALLIGSDDAPDYVIAAATLVVAALFRPVRRRVQEVVDHRFNRKRYDAERTIEAFTTRLREEIDIDALGAELEGVVARTMQPAHARLWLRSAAPGRTTR